MATQQTVKIISNRDEFLETISWNFKGGYINEQIKEITKIKTDIIHPTKEDQLKFI